MLTPHLCQQQRKLADSTPVSPHWWSTSYSSKFSPFLWHDFVAPCPLLTSDNYVISSGIFDRAIISASFNICIYTSQLLHTWAAIVQSIYPACTGLSSTTTNTALETITLTPADHADLVNKCRRAQGTLSAPSLGSQSVAIQLQLVMKMWTKILNSGIEMLFLLVSGELMVYCTDESHSFCMANPIISPGVIV